MSVAGATSIHKARRLALLDDRLVGHRSLRKGILVLSWSQSVIRTAAKYTIHLLVLLFRRPSSGRYVVEMSYTLCVSSETYTHSMLEDLH